MHKSPKIQSKKYSIKSNLISINNIGSKKIQIFKSLGIETPLDLLYFFPRKHVDRTSFTKIKNLKKGDLVSIIASVEAFGLRRSKKRNFFELIISDKSGIIKCIWFNGSNYMNKIFSIGDKLIVSGKVDFFKGYQLIHPEYDIINLQDMEPLNSGGIIPIYPSNELLKKVGLESRGLRKIIREILLKYNFEDQEFFEKKIINKENLYPLNLALKNIHFSKNLDELKKSIFRLKFNEHFYIQLLMAYRKVKLKNLPGKEFLYKKSLISQILKNIKFELTNAQKRTLKEIFNDMIKAKVMNRLIQGDVGSGKTIVAIISSYLVVKNKSQVAIMVPTEILARQHLSQLLKYLKNLNVSVGLLVGNLKKKNRVSLLDDIKNGKIDIVIGTHAIFQEDVIFKNLGLIVIDEQQRFGVSQRDKLFKKGNNPDILSMTATPIPRSLAIAYHSDMDISLIDEKPNFRKKIITKVISNNQINKVYDFIKNKIKNGEQCIIVFPLINESEKLDLKAAIIGFEELKKIFNNLKVELLHGKMDQSEKEIIMNDFSNNKINILVSTTVIEVGIDVPNATVMLIENSERFGLSQLHQLRGRIGRGSKEGYCILNHTNRNENSIKRMEIMESTNDGFKISDYDLKLRGPGEFYGEMQHGFPKMKIGDIINDLEIIKKAKEVASELIFKDPELKLRKNKKIRANFFKEFKNYMKVENIL
tara:strand:+ start:12614 stop:14722 length:2109 start_codon:yes stop_codon:yes gene_type:complete